MLKLLIPDGNYQAPNYLNVTYKVCEGKVNLQHAMKRCSDMVLVRWSFLAWAVSSLGAE